MLKNEQTNIRRSEVVDLVKSDEEEITDPEGVTIYIAAQLLSSAYRHYKESGMTDADFNRMPACAFTDSLKSLFRDLKLIIDAGY